MPAPDGTATGAVLVQAAVSTGLVLLGAFAVMKLAEQSFSPFLYFQF